MRTQVENSENELRKHEIDLDDSKKKLYALNEQNLSDKLKENEQQIHVFEQQVSR